MMFSSKVQIAALDTGQVISLRCPFCRQQGTLEPVGGADMLVDESIRLGQRRCPNPTCRAHIFFAWKNRVITSYPAERIDFDASNLPQPVLSVLEEALTSHANGCFVAAAIMVRKTLEELCRDRGAIGPTLKERIKGLGSKVVLPNELMEGLDVLRLLGNDAAHVESQTYSQIGRPEVEVGIEFTKEVLKAVYQYSALLDRLRGLRKGP